MEFLSERVSLDRSKGRLSIVISARLSRARETLLVTWFLAWLACGGYVIHQVTQLGPGSARQFLYAFLAFWLYFVVRIGRVVLWRLKGFELLRVKDGTLTIKNSIFGFGRAHDYFIDNISGLTLLEIDPRSWKFQLNESFWVMGGERLCFQHVGRQVIFGKGLDAQEAGRVLTLLKAELAKTRKGTEQKQQGS
jgi:hypothetical protein